MGNTSVVFPSLSIVQLPSPMMEITKTIGEPLITICLTAELTISPQINKKYI
jgi:hypothetical protein